MASNIMAAENERHGAMSGREARARHDIIEQRRGIRRIAAWRGIGRALAWRRLAHVHVTAARRRQKHQRRYEEGGAAGVSKTAINIAYQAHRAPASSFARINVAAIGA